MATNAYMSGRMKWGRPQALLFANNSGTIVTPGNKYIPNGEEGTDFIILSDHNRSPISISSQRIETRSRMINGTMRSYHTADKINLQVSWSNLPSRSYSSIPSFTEGELNQTSVYGPNNSYKGQSPEEYTVDGGAGGSDLLEWYEANVGSFWVYFAYDKTGSGVLNRYSNIFQMYFSSFEYDIQKRGNAWSSGTAGGFDMWNVSMSLEQV